MSYTIHYLRRRVTFFRMLAAVILFPCTVLAAEPYSASDLIRTRDVTSAVISPKGDRVAYTVEVMRPAGAQPGNSYSELYVVSVAANISRPLVVGEERATSVAWRPDGSAIAFIAKREADRVAQVWMVSADGGSPKRLTSSETEVNVFRWSPDGKTLCYVAATPKSSREKALAKAGYDFVLFEEDLRHRNLYLLEVDVEGNAGAVTQLTNEATVWTFEFAPDGATVAVAVSEKNLVDHEYMFQKIYLLTISSKTRKQITNNPGKLGNYAFSPDGKHLAYNAAISRNDHKASQVFVISTSGGEARNLTIPKFRGHVSWVGWRDNGTVLYRCGEGVQTTLSAVKVGGGDRQVLLNSQGTGVVFDRLTLSGNGKHIACVGESPSIPGEAYYWGSGGAMQRLTTVNPWLDWRALGRQEGIRYPARDNLEIEGLVIYPIGYKKGERYPLIVVVHGGPESHYSNGWLGRYSEPAQVLAGKGYVVFFPNYRSSTGYGVEFATKGFGDPAGKEFDDIADGIDYLVAQGIADRERVGLGGGSYGGYASAWFATYYTKYVKAVCMSVGVSDLISRHGSTDIPLEELAVHSGKRLDAMWDLALKRSPIYWVSQSETATLIMGGLADTRVHPSQSLELYRQMKVHNHPAVRLVQYPGEKHGNSRQPGRIDVLYRTIEWYDWYVRDAKPLNGPMPPLDISEKYGLDLTADPAMPAGSDAQ